MEIRKSVVYKINNIVKLKLLIPVTLLIICPSIRAQSWHSIGSPSEVNISVIDTAGGKLYVAGQITLCNSSDSTPTYCYNSVKVWTNVQWNYARNFAGLGNLNVWCMASYQDNNYEATGQSGIISESSGVVANVPCFAMVDFGNNLCAGGQFDSVPGVHVNNIALWNGTNWSPMGKGLNDSVTALAVYNGNLYAGGNFDSAGGIHANHIAMWNGTAWDSIIGGGINGTISAMISWNGNLYVGGYFTMAGGIPVHNIAMWNGTVWNSVGSGTDTAVNAFAVYNGNLYAGGCFDSAGGKRVNYIAEWNGVSWDSLGSGMDEVVTSLTVFDGALCAAGVFGTAGGVSVDNIAGWCNGCTVGIDQLTVNNAQLKVYPNPSNGVFTIENQGVSDKEQLEIYNMLGENIYNTSFNTTTTQINLSGQAPGIYLYRVVSEKGEAIGSGKLIISQ